MTTSRFLAPLLVALTLSGGCAATDAFRHRPNYRLTGQDFAVDVTAFAAGVALQYDATHGPYNRTEDMTGLTITAGVFIIDAVALLLWTGK